MSLKRVCPYSPPRTVACVWNPSLKQSPFSSSTFSICSQRLLSFYSPPPPPPPPTPAAALSFPSQCPTLLRHIACSAGFPRLFQRAGSLWPDLPAIIPTQRRGGMGRILAECVGPLSLSFTLSLSLSLSHGFSLQDHRLSQRGQL